MSTHRPAPAGPWAISTRELGRRPGTMRTYTGVVPGPTTGWACRRSGSPPGAPVELDLRLESVTEGVYVSGTAHARLEGECARCLDPLTDEITVDDR